MGPEALAQVLRPLQNMFKSQKYPELLVGLENGDDAAVYKINDDVAIIHTIDFFTPVVDDPYQYGAIAAANAMSDVYAMGGKVILALNVCGFPSDLPKQIISEILRGGAEKVAESGGILAGGHTINDKEPKYGLSVLGQVHPEQVITTAGARAGDILILTKPLGVGLVTTAFKGDKAETIHLKKAVKSMMTLNKDAALLMQKINVHACTDITGFSILGHCYEMASKSNIQIILYLAKLPLIEGASDYANKRLFPGGSRKNEQYYKKHVNFDSSISDAMKMMLFTPETSGGLLAAVSRDSLKILRDLFTRNKHPFWIVGEIKDGHGVEVIR